MEKVNELFRWWQNFCLWNRCCHLLNTVKKAAANSTLIKAHQTPNSRQPRQAPAVDFCWQQLWKIWACCIITTEAGCVQMKVFFLVPQNCSREFQTIGPAKTRRLHTWKWKYYITYQLKTIMSRLYISASWHCTWIFLYYFSLFSLFFHLQFTVYFVCN